MARLQQMSTFSRKDHFYGEVLGEGGVGGGGWGEVLPFAKRISLFRVTMEMLNVIII